MKDRKPMHDNWKTPDYLLADIEAEFGKFFDPCPLNLEAITPETNGLLKEWASVNYINPPYNRLDKEAFIRKAYSESLKGNTCIMLLPVSTSTKIFHEVIYPNAEIRFLKGRVKFEGINSFGKLVSNKCGMHDTMMVIFRRRLNE